MLVVQEAWRWTKPLPGSVSVKDGLITVEPGHWDFYDPFALSNLPNALAHVEGQKAALEFVQRFGLLGYSRLMESTRGPYEGDPVEWILSHARSVNFALELITEARLQRAEAELAAEEKKAGINRALDKALVEGRVRALVEKNITIIPFNTVVSNAPDGAKASGHMWPIGTSNEFAQYSAATWADNFEHLIPQMLSNVVNKNTAGVRPQLMYSGEGPNGLQLQFSANALVEVVWYKVGEMAAMAWQRDGAGLRSCKACGRLFIVTDRRQMFCPKNSLPGQQIGSSSCGSRYRQRENRRSK